MNHTRRSPAPYRLAFVLGSGGVRSIAALGVAGRLAREGICPDFVAGCSSGALFGAQIALGMEGEEALRVATSLWSPELTQQRRWRAYAELLAPRWMGFDGRFAMRDDRLIAQRVECAFGNARLESTEVPLRVSATDAMTGEAVVLTRGRVADAVRASMAVPIIFPSVVVDGRALVDGVLSDPLPLAAAQDARVVIALGFDGDMPRRVDRISRLVAQTSTALINNLMHARKAAARSAGQEVIDLRLDLDRRIGLWDTSAMPDLYEAGWRAADACLSDIDAALERASLEARAYAAAVPAAWAH